MPWTFYNASGEAMIIDGGVQASAAVFTANADLGSNLLVGNAGSTGIAISSAGEVTMAAQPAVFAYNSASDTDVTGTGSAATVDFDTEVFDQNSDFASDEFNAPITGRYLVNTGVTLEDLNAAGATNMRIEVRASNRTTWVAVGQDLSADDSNISWGGSVILDMDATDTLTIAVLVFGSSAVVDVVGDSNPKTFISVMLMA
jgi:xanthine/CO dehydrogenase XdhC/CoxF family maturation factor